MSDKHTELMTDEEILKGLKREAMMTAAPERFRLYGDAYARLKALTKERNELKVLVKSAYEEGFRDGTNETVRSGDEWIEDWEHSDTKTELGGDDDE